MSFLYVTTTSFSNNRYHLARKESQEQDVYEFSNNVDEYCIIRLQKNKYTIIDKKYMNEVMKYNWYLHIGTGYIAHRIRNNEEELGKQNEPKNSSIYLHTLIKRLESGDPNFNIERHVTSVDHINRQKYDNRVSNLRIATNSEQNYNQKMRCDRKGPHEELFDIGITEYSRHIRFDNTQQRFVLESHPQLKKENKKILNGTRKGSIIEKYFEILHIGHELDKEFMKNDTTIFEGKQETEFKKCIDIINSFNNYQENKEKVISIEDAYETFTDTSSYKSQIDFMFTNEDLGLKDPHIIHEEDGYVLTKKMIKKLPSHIYFTLPKKNRGCYFEYDFKDPETKTRNIKRFGSSVKVSLKEKYDTAMNFLKEDTTKTSNSQSMI
jgi:hypothetical protein